MGNNLSVSVTADVRDLATKFAIAKAEVSGLSSEVTKLARASAAGIIDPAGTARLQQLAGDLVHAKSNAASFAEQLKAMRTASSGLGGTLEEMRASMSKAFALTGIGIAVEGVIKLGEAITQLGERAIQIRTLSDVLGVSTSQLQAMQVAAEESGIEMTTLARAGEHLTVMLEQARGGSGKAVEKLLALGITTKDIASPTFQLNDALAVLKVRLEDTNTAEATRKALLQDLGARGALAIAAIKEYDGSQQGVARAMAAVNGLSADQVDRLAKMKAGWSEMATTLSNRAAQAMAAVGNMLAAYKSAVLAKNPTLTPGATTSGPGRDASSTGEQRAAQESARVQEAAHSEVLRDEMEKIKDGVAAFASGTAERLSALRQYAALAKQYFGSGNVDEVRKANSEVLAAEREYRVTQGREAIAAAHEQISEIGTTTRVGAIQRLEAERDVWTQTIIGARLTSAQYVEVQRSLNQSVAAIERERVSQAAAIARSDASTEIAISKIQLAEKRRALDEEVSANEISAAQKRTVMRQLAAESFNLDLRSLESELSTLQAGTAAYEESFNKVRELKAKLTADLMGYDSEYAKDAARQLKQQETQWHAAVGEIEKVEGTFVSDVLGGRKSMAQSLRSIGAQIVTQEISNDLKAYTTKFALKNQEKALEQGGLLFHLLSQGKAAQGTIASQGAQTGATVAGNTARLTSEASAAGESKSIQAATGGPQVMADAAKAAAGAYSALAGIPIIGPFIAPVAAGVAFAAVSAWEGAASLDIGTNYVPRDMPAYIHEGEAVVPKEYNPAAGGSGHDGGGDGPGYQEQHNYNGDVHMSSLDTRGFAAFLKSPGNRGAIAQAARTYFSRGGGRR